MLLYWHYSWPKVNVMEMKPSQKMELLSEQSAVQLSVGNVNNRELTSIGPGKTSRHSKCQSGLS